MTKVRIAFFFLAIFTIAKCQTIEYSRFWKLCKEQILQYSNSMINYPKNKMIYNLLDCQKWEYEIKNYCQNIYYIEPAVNLYKECLKPFKEQYKMKCRNFNYICASEIDKCQFCQQTESCKTGAKMPKYSELQDIQNGIDTNCGNYKHSSYCDSAELTTIAYNSCKLYYIKKCSNEFYQANFEEDGCFDEYNCIQSVLSTTYLKITLILMIAFFAY